MGNDYESQEIFGYCHVNIQCKTMVSGKHNDVQMCEKEM